MNLHDKKKHLLPIECIKYQINLDCRSLCDFYYRYFGCFYLLDSYFLGSL